MEVNPLVQLIPISIMCIWVGFIANALARDKGRNVTKWTILGFIPIVNFICLSFFMGAANLRLERKVDDLIELQRRS
jgi:hypothetical protein